MSCRNGPTATSTHPVNALPAALVSGVTEGADGWADDLAARGLSRPSAFEFAPPADQPRTSTRGRADSFLKAFACSIVGRTRLGRTQHGISLVEERCIPLVTTEVRVMLERLHQGAVTCPDDLKRCIRLDAQQSIVVSSVLPAHTCTSTGVFHAACQDPGRLGPRRRGWYGRPPDIVRRGNNARMDVRFGRIPWSLAGAGSPGTRPEEHRASAWIVDPNTNRESGLTLLRAHSGPMNSRHICVCRVFRRAEPYNSADRVLTFSRRCPCVRRASIRNPAIGRWHDPVSLHT